MSLKRFNRLWALLCAAAMIWRLVGLQTFVHEPAEACTLHLVWLAPSNDFWEQDFLIDTLLRRQVAVERQQPAHVACRTFHSEDSCSFTVLVARWISLLEELPREFLDASCAYGIIHTSDETLGESPSPLYNRPGVRFVLRQYALPSGHVSGDRVRTIGLGYKRGFWDGVTGGERMAEAVTVASRPLVWSFAGTLHHEERRRAVEAFQALMPHQVDTTSHFDAPDGLSTSSYRDTLLASKFVLAPLGHVNLDTFRLYEALEAGAIPIAMRVNPMLSAHWNYSGPYWPLVFGADIQFVVHDSWEAAADEVQRALAAPQQLEARRLRVLDMWRRHKEDTAAWVNQHIAAALRERSAIVAL